MLTGQSFIQFPVPGLGEKYWSLSGFLSHASGRWRFFDRNIRPDFRVFRVQRQPFLKPRLGISLDRVDRTFRLANTAVNAFVRVDHKHVLTLVETIHGAYLDAVHGFAANAALIDDVGQSYVLSADRSGHNVGQKGFNGLVLSFPASTCGPPMGL